MMVPGEFILASSETERLERRKAKEREQEEAEKNTVPDKTVFQKELDNILKDFGSENAPVEKVLEKNKVNFPEKIARNLYNDYMSMRNYNTDGMLGIHQAVVANDIKGVKRFLMMIRLLSPLGIDVDVRTLDGNVRKILFVFYCLKKEEKEWKINNEMLFFRRVWNWQWNAKLTSKSLRNF